MTQEATTEAPGLPVATRIVIDGNEWSNTIAELRLRQKINEGHHELKVVIQQVADVDREGDFIDGDVFAPLIGKSLSLSVAEDASMLDSSDALSWLGFISRTDFSHSRGGGMNVVVTAHSPTYKLDRSRRLRTFEEVTDADVMGQVCREHGIQANIPTTSTTHPLVLQYNETDWEFLLRLASNNGFVVAYDGERLRIGPVADAPEITLDWNGAEVSKFSLNLQAHPHKVNVAGWEPWNAEPLFADEQFRGAPEPLIDHALQGTSRAYDGDQYIDTSFDSRQLEETVTRDLASYRAAARARFAFGALTTVSPKAIADVRIRLNNMGDYSGVYHVWDCQHQIVANSYQNVAQVVPASIAAPIPKERKAKPPASMVAQVVDIQDPENRYRIKVLTAEGWITDWLPVATLDAGEGAGSKVGFLPNTHDEVVITFQHNDPEKPVAVGSLFQTTHQLPEESGAGDSLVLVADGESASRRRFIRSSSGHTILLDDTAEEEKIIISTSGGESKIVMTCGEDGLSITTEEQLFLSGKTITLEAEESITLQAGSDGVTVEGGTIELTATEGDLKGEGANLDLKGQTAAKIEGGATADLKSGGQTKVEGGVVMIN